jgi:hypothetical protein
VLHEIDGVILSFYIFGKRAGDDSTGRTLPERYQR